MYADDPSSLSKRASFYEHGNRSSMYDNASLDYGARPASSHHYLGSNPKLPGHGYAQLTEGRQSYGDVRKSAQVYGRAGTSFEESEYRGRSQPRDYRSSVHGRVASNEVVYDRF